MRWLALLMLVACTAPEPVETAVYLGPSGESPDTTATIHNYRKDSTRIRWNVGPQTGHLHATMTVTTLYHIEPFDYPGSRTWGNVPLNGEVDLTIDPSFALPDSVPGSVRVYWSATLRLASMMVPRDSATVQWTTWMKPKE